MSKSSPGDLHLSTNEAVTRPKDPAILSPKSPRDIPSFDSSNYGSSYLARAIPTSGSEASSGDESVELYREKLEHLQILVRQLHKQLQSEKIRKEGVETLSRCLKDERQENTKLKEGQKRFEEIIRTLQSRLATNGLTTSVDLEPGEKFVPGIVGQTAFDSLVKENLSLKSDLKYLTIDPSKMEDVLKQNNTLREQILGLQQEILQLRHDKQEVQSFLSSTDDDKVQEIAKLRQEILELRQQGISKDVLCQSISEQSHALKERLRETGALCQQLLQRLEKLEAPPEEQDGTQSPLGASFVKLSLAGATNPGSTTPNKHTVQEEIIGLRGKLQEVVQVNQKWQEYHDKREAEFSSLQARLEDREQRLAQGPNVETVSQQHQEQINKLMKQYKKQIGGIEDEREKLSDENRQIRIQLNTQITENQRLEEKLKGLLAQLRNRPVDSGSKEDRDRIMALEMQIKTCTEDFESERRDRERAHSRIADMEREVQIYKSQLESFQRGAMSRINMRRSGHNHHYGNYVQCDLANLDDEPMPEPSPPPHLIGRGIYQTDSEDVEGEDTIDMPMPRMINRHELPNSSENTSQKKMRTSESVLQCPQCQKSYPEDKHSELLVHMDECLK